MIKSEKKMYKKNNHHNDQILLSIRDVDYEFRSSSSRLFKGINLEIARGEVISITGKSGAGKSTLLFIAGGLIKPNSGVAEAKCKIGFVYQNPHLIECLSLLENVMLGSQLAGMSQERSKQKAIGLLSQLGIDFDREPRSLSSGEKQRVAIAQTIICEPDLILADEPTGNLDTHNARLTTSLLKQVTNNGISLLLATHDKNLAEIANKKLKLENSKLQKIT